MCCVWLCFMKMKNKVLWFRDVLDAYAYACNQIRKKLKSVVGGATMVGADAPAKILKFIPLDWLKMPPFLPFFSAKQQVIYQEIVTFYSPITFN